MQGDLFTDTDVQKRIKSKFDHLFHHVYNELNPEQKAAVDQVEGPVMVVAGPGTGKTQILAVRIGKILKDTDANPHNILCLTYTDAATLAMRKRLVEIIGPTAHQIHIYTFHAFCNQVIQENLGIFGNYRQLEPITDIEEIEVYKKILDNLPSDHILKNLKGNDQYEMRRLKNLFSFMKKENIDKEKIAIKVKDYLRRKKLDIHDPKLFYQRKYKEFNKHDPKPGAWDDIEYRMRQLTEASNLLEKYESIMTKVARYDFQDMLLWVLKAFQNDPLLLPKYQERYQYILVDEYQDTNGTQNDLLEIMISYWEENPNVFVVGDDDQAIYKFQGANLDNIKDFKEKYDPVTIVLKRNYRSSQPILDSAKNLISFNTERLINVSKYDLDKDLIAEGPNKDVKINPEILSFQNETNENAYLSDLFYGEYQNGADLNKIAILYRQHSQVKSLVEVLEKRGIPLNIKRSVNILYSPLVQSILTILNFINIEQKRPNGAENRLGELMYYDFFNISSDDVARISLNNRMNRDEGKRSLREIISDEDILAKIGVKDIPKVLHLSSLLNQWISAISNTTLQVLFEKVINDGLILRTILNHGNKIWMLQVLNTFFDFIKSETAKKPDLTLDEFLSLIETMKDNDVPMSVNKVIYAENGIHFLTAHSSKGLEFEKVFILGATKDKWDKSHSTRFQYTYPDNLNEDTETNEQDERRLFFVAVTRAERELYITYADKKDTGKVLGASQFVDEISVSINLKKKEQAVSADQITNFQIDALTILDKKIELIDHNLIDKALDTFKISVTGLNKYLKCPTVFYFEDVLRIPTARSKYMGFGRAIHHAFQFYYQNIMEGKGGIKETLQRNFVVGMKDHLSHFTIKEYTDMTAYGKSILEKYYEKYLKSEIRAETYELELKIEHADFMGVPIKGVLDRVAINKKVAKVIDYKTGNYTRPETKKKLASPSEKNTLGGDYWRQIVFYNILAESDTRIEWKMESGIIDFVEPDKKTNAFYKKEFRVSLEDKDLVGEQIVDTWKRIHNHEFQEGCKEENCYWCNFVKNDFVFPQGLILEHEDEMLAE